MARGPKKKKKFNLTVNCEAAVCGRMIFCGHFPCQDLDEEELLLIKQHSGDSGTGLIIDTIDTPRPNSTTYTHSNKEKVHKQPRL